MGPTASGKTELAEGLAGRLDAILINADAFQVYRGFDIGTAKPADRTRYHLLDIKDPNEQFGLGEWLTLAQEILRRQYSQSESAIVVGGTGLYIRALFERFEAIHPPPEPALRARLMEREQTEGPQALVAELEAAAPAIAARIDRSNPLRVRRALENLSSPAPAAVSIPYQRQIKIAIDVPADELEARIRVRTRAMLAGGWVEEVQRLLTAGVSPDSPAMRGIGYRTILSLLRGEIGAEEAFEEIVRETRRYAKRQRTWLRSEPNVQWVRGLEEAFAVLK